MLKKLSNFLFTNQTIRQTVAKNTFWLSISQIGGRLLRAIVIIYSARILGAEGWGIFSYAVGLAAFLTIFIDLGVSAILTKETAKTTDELQRSKILSTSFFIKIFLISIGVLLVLFVAPKITTIKEAHAILPLVALIMVFDALREFGFSISRAMEKMEWEAGLYLLTNVCIVIFGFIFLMLSPNVFSFTAAYTVGTGIGMFATFFSLRKYFKNIISNFDKTLIKYILIAAFPFAISSALGSLTINTDILIIGLFKSSTEIGFYSAAQRPTQLLYILPAILAMSIFPTIARLAKENKDKIRDLLEKIISIAFMAALPLSLGGFILAPLIIKTLFGENYGGAIIPFQILIFTLITNFPTTLLSNAIFAFDKQKLLINFALIGGLTNAGLDFLLVPKYGIIGASVVTLLAQILSNLYLLYQVKKISSFKILGHLKKVIFASVSMAFIVLILTKMNLSIFIIIPMGIIVYLGTLYLLREKLLREVKLIFF